MNTSNSSSQINILIFLLYLFLAFYIVICIFVVFSFIRVEAIEPKSDHLEIFLDLAKNQSSLLVPINGFIYSYISFVSTKENIWKKKPMMTALIIVTSFIFALVFLGESLYLSYKSEALINTYPIDLIQINSGIQLLQSFYTILLSYPAILLGLSTQSNQE